MSGVMLVAGESSGDVLGARLAAELKNHRPNCVYGASAVKACAKPAWNALPIHPFIGNGLLGRAFAHAGDIGVTSSLAG